MRPARQVGIYALAVLLLAPYPAGSEEAKPPQRKRLAGLKPLTREQMEDFLSERRNALLATINKDGTPQITPVIFYWDGQAFYVSTTKETAKYQNLLRDPRMSLVVDDVLDHRVVIAKGRVEIREQDIWDTTRKIIYKYYGRKEGDPYLARLQKQPRVLLVLKPEKVRTWGPVPRGRD